MALDYFILYGAGLIDAGTASYPFGQPRDVSAPAAGDGTPMTEESYRDWIGWMARLLTEAAITPSGAPESALASDIHDALNILFLQRSELVENGGNITTIGDRFPAEHIHGLQMIWDSITLETMKPGGVRNLADAIDIELAADLQKATATEWVLGGAGNGALPNALVPAVANQWYRRFLVMTADGLTVDWTIDTDAAAANFFADADAVAAGFTDATFFRRMGWVLFDGAINLQKYHNLESEPRRSTWDIHQTEVNQNGAAPQLGSVARDTFVLENVAPDTFGTMNIGGSSGSGTDAILITISEQLDSAANQLTGFTLEVHDGTGNDSGGIVGEWKVDSSQQINARANSTDINGFNLIVTGWRDPAIIA